MKKFKIPVLLLLLLAAVFAIGACGGNTPATDEYKVEFNLNYSGAPAATSVTVKSGETVGEPAQKPTREGYAFVGWYKETLGINAYDFTTPVTSNLRLFAKWGMTTATVTFEYNNGDDATTVPVDVGEKVSRPATDPTRTDYEFTGWYSNPACTDTYDFDEEVTENLTVYAGWKQLVATVNIVISDDKTETQRVDIDGKATEPDEPTREDYEFTGWFKDSNFRTTYDFDEPVKGDLTIYAGWKLVRATITYNMNYEGSTSDSAKVTVGEAATEPADPDRTGYDFKGWYYDAACTSAYNFGIDVTESLELFARWELHEYTVTFNANFAGGQNSTALVKYNETADSPETDPTRTGYIFGGWYTDAACTTAYDWTAPITKDTVIYAGWTEESGNVGENVARFMLNYGDNEVYDTQSFTAANSRATEPATDPERDGYFFAGWAKDAEGKTMWNFRNDRVNGTTNLYAKWLKGYTFEAEYTYLTNKPATGTSQSGVGPDIILQTPTSFIDNGASAGMSNGAMAGLLYINGSYLDFEINSSEEVTDAVLVLRLTGYLFNLYLSDEEWQIVVNRETPDEYRVNYGHLSINDVVHQTEVLPDGSEISGDANIRPLKNYVMTMSLHLKKGNNTIRLLANNQNNHTATYQCDFPMVDCMYIYSNSDLTWAEGKCYPQNMAAVKVDQTMADVSYAVTYNTGRKDTCDREPQADDAIVGGAPSLVSLRVDAILPEDSKKRL